jgi:hypothetical protein
MVRYYPVIPPAPAAGARETDPMSSSNNERAVKKAISLPPELARFAMATAREEGKTLSAVVQDAMRAYRLARLRGEYRELQGYWSQRAREKGVLTDRQLDRYLQQKD